MEPQYNRIEQLQFLCEWLGFLHSFHVLPISWEEKDRSKQLKEKTCFLLLGPLNTSLRLYSFSPPQSRAPWGCPGRSPVAMTREPFASGRPPQPCSRGHGIAPCAKLSGAELWLMRGGQMHWSSLVSFLLWVIFFFWRVDYGGHELEMEGKAGMSEICWWWDRMTAWPFSLECQWMICFSSICFHLCVQRFFFQSSWWRHTHWSSSPWLMTESQSWDIMRVRFEPCLPHAHPPAKHRPQAERVRGARHRAREAWIQRKPPIDGFKIVEDIGSPVVLLEFAEIGYQRSNGLQKNCLATRIFGYMPQTWMISTHQSKQSTHSCIVAWTSSQVKCVKRQILSSCGRKIKSTLGTSRNNIHQSQHVQSPNTLH